MRPTFLYRVKYTAVMDEEIIPGKLLVNQESEELASELALEVLRALDIPEPRIQKVICLRESRLNDMYKWWTQVMLYELTEVTT